MSTPPPRFRSRPAVSAFPRIPRLPRIPPPPTPRGDGAALVRLVLRTPFTRRAWAELLYAVAALPLALIVFPPTLMLLSAGVMLSITVVGLGFLMLLMLFARGTGAMRRAFARAVLGVDVPGPPPPVRREGITGRIRARIGDPGGWRAVAYTVLALPLSFVMAFGAVLSWFNGVVLTVYPALWQLHRATSDPPAGAREGTFVHVGGLTPQSLPGAFALTVLGVLVLLAAPWITRALVLCDRWLIGALLGPTRAQRRIRDLEDTRAQVVEDAAAKLRRIERDLHDGAQARVVAVAMTLGMAREKLGEDDGGADADVTRARTLVDNALDNARRAITELRDLARGIHPPVLDQGLDAALATLAACGPLPVELETDLARRPPAAVEAIAYFCVAELLTNAARHGGASRAGVTAVVRGDHLIVVVTDDGRGGARPGGGTGLSGLADRVRSVDGRMSIDSPPGGPTVVTITLPLGGSS